jgi:DUF177 domain-containing protein
MLRVETSRLKGGPVTTSGTLDPQDPGLAGLVVQFVGPVEVDGMLQATAQGDYVWQGHIRAHVAGQCRRCLADLTPEVEDDVDVVFSSDPALLDDPGVYALSPDPAVVDVTPAVREELALRVPAYPLCRSDCKGLCPRCGADLNAGPCHCARPA